MKRLLQTFSGSFLLFTCAMFGVAQEVVSTSVAKSDEKGSVRIYRRYEKSRNETTTETKLMAIFGNNLGTLDMNVSYTSAGESSTAPHSVTITFISSNPEHQHNRNLIVKADGELFKPGAMEYLRVPDSNAKSGFTGKLSLPLSVEAFSRIARAKNVHIELGPENFSLEKRHLWKLRGLVDAMTQ